MLSDTTRGVIEVGVVCFVMATLALFVALRPKESILLAAWESSLLRWIPPHGAMARMLRERAASRGGVSSERAIGVVMWCLAMAFPALLFQGWTYAPIVAGSAVVLAVGLTLVGGTLLFGRKPVNASAEAQEDGPCAVGFPPSLPNSRGARVVMRCAGALLLLAGAFVQPVWLVAAS